MLARRPEDVVDDGAGEIVGDHDLLEQAGRDQVEGAARVHCPRVAGRVELRDQLVRSHDRARDQVWEEGQVGGELLERDRDEVAAIRVDHVADRHEGVEGHPDRQHDRPQAEWSVEPDDREQVVARADEEVEVLEVAEHADVAGERDCEEELPLRRHAGAVDGDGEDVVPERRSGEQEDEMPVPPAVEDVARGDDERAPAVWPRHRQPRERQHEQEEDRKGGGGEEHASGSKATAVEGCAVPQPAALPPERRDRHDRGRPPIGAGGSESSFLRRAARRSSPGHLPEAE